ncbi:MAG: hypothetical protein LKG23_01085 [Nitrospira sp.]|jgi:hypothetical protein|nr:hypothetical protein [Nitrospira sp.]
MKPARHSKRLTPSRQTRLPQVTLKQEEKLGGGELEAWMASVNAKLDAINTMIARPQRGPIGRRLEVARDTLEARRIKQKILGLPGPGRPKQTINAQSLGIFLAIDSGTVSKAAVLKAFGKDLKAGNNISARYRWINRRIESGRQAFHSLTQQEQLSNRKHVQRMRAEQLLKWIPAIPSS